MGSHLVLVARVPCTIQDAYGLMLQTVTVPMFPESTCVVPAKKIFPFGATVIAEASALPLPVSSSVPAFANELSKLPSVFRRTTYAVNGPNGGVRRLPVTKHLPSAWSAIPVTLVPLLGPAP